MGADDWPNKQERVQRLLASMKDDGSPDTEQAVLNLATLVLAHGAPRMTWQGEHAAGWFQELRVAVAADGWEYDIEAQRLVPTVPGVNASAHADAVERALVSRRWTVAAGHYRQALDTFAQGRWASANAQLRSTLEETLPLAAQVVGGTRPTEVQAALDILKAKNQLADGEYGFAKGLWTLCQSAGPHPGLSGEEESRFRVVSVTTYLRFLLDRLP